MVAQLQGEAYQDDDRKYASRRVRLNARFSCNCDYDCFWFDRRFLVAEMVICRHLEARYFIPIRGIIVPIHFANCAFFYALFLLFFFLYQIITTNLKCYTVLSVVSKNFWHELLCFFLMLLYIYRENKWEKIHNEC